MASKKKKFSHPAVEAQAWRKESWLGSGSTAEVAAVWLNSTGRISGSIRSQPSLTMQMKGRLKGRVCLSSHALSVQLLLLLSAIVKLGCVCGFSLMPLNDISRHTQTCSLMGGSSICALGARLGVAPCDAVHAGLMGMVMQQRGRGGERGGRGAARGEAGSRGRPAASRGSKGPSWDRVDDEERIGSKRPDFARLRRESNRETVNHA